MESSTSGETYNNDLFICFKRFYYCVLTIRNTLYFSFSNRMFFQKAVAIWTGSSDLEHLEIVGRYLHFATSTTSMGVDSKTSSAQCNCLQGNINCTCPPGGAYRGFEMKPVAFDLSPSANSDPLYVVKACVKGCKKEFCDH